MFQTMMLRDILTYLANRYTLLLYFLGLTIISLGRYLPTVLGTQISQLFESIGFSIVATTLVASVLNFNFHAAIHESFAIVKGAERAQIHRIFGTRKQALVEMNAQATRVTSRMDILSVSATSFLQPRAKILQEIERRARNANSVTIRILLLDPRSAFAIERSIREEEADLDREDLSGFGYPDRKLPRDTLLALQQLKMILEDAAQLQTSNFEIVVRLYDSAPMTMYVRLDNRIFLEQYHYGVPREQMKSRFTRCLGKAVPLVEAESKSQLGDIMSSHFDYLWDDSVTREISLDSYKKLQTSLRSGDYLRNFLEDREKRRRELSLNDIENPSLGCKGEQAPEKITPDGPAKRTLRSPA